jgi:hypothetical protein
LHLFAPPRAQDPLRGHGWQGDHLALASGWCERLYIN